MQNAVRSTHPLVLVAAGSVVLASLAATAHFTGLLPSRTAEPPPTVVSMPAPAAPAPAPLVAQAPAATEPVAPAPPAAVAAEQPAAAPAATKHASKPAHRNPPANTVAHHQTGTTDSDPYGGSSRRVSTGDNGIDVIPARSATPPDTMPPPPPNAPVAQAPQAVCHECGRIEAIQEVTTRGEGTGLGAIAGGVLGGILGHQVGRGGGKDLATIAGAVGGAVAGHQVERNTRSEKQYQVTVRLDDGTLRTVTQASNGSLRQGDRVRLSNGSIVPM